MNTTETGMRPGASTGETGPQAGISFREAGIRLGISDKTLRARIREGTIEGWTVAGKRGLEWRVRLPDAEEEFIQADRASDREGRAAEEHVIHGARDEDREGERDEGRDPLALARAEIAFLREQLSARTTAEEQLRVLLMQLEKTNAELAASLCQKALPPASVPPAANPPRFRWFRFWGRRS